MDDDTLVFPYGLLHALEEYKSTHSLMIGGLSETHRLAGRHGYMAFGGGGYAMTYTATATLASITPECIIQYKEVSYGGDERLHKCMRGSGIKLIFESGFHQTDLNHAII